MKIYLTFLLIVSTAFTTLLSPKQTDAWSGSLPSCDLTGFDFIGKIQSVDASYTLAEGDSFYVAKNPGAIEVGYTKVGQPFPIEFSKGSEYQVISTNLMRFNLTTFDLISIGSNQTRDNYNCVSFTKNATYASSWDTSHFPTYDGGEVSPPAECPDGQIGTPPDCTTPTPTTCPEGQVGTPPDCTTPTSPPVQENYNIPFPQKVGIVMSLLLSAGIIYIFRFTRHE